MNLLQTVTLAIVQGITELLPVSSSGHLLLVSKYLFETEITQSMLVGLHLGTTLAILIYFAKDILSLLKNNGSKFILNLILASIPAGVVGILFGDALEAIFYNPRLIAFSLILWGVVFIAVEQLINRKKSSLSKISTLQSLIMGIGQTVALIPGTSRSGITTVAGILSGLDKYTALQYSFIMGLPVLLGSIVLVFLKQSPAELSIFSIEMLLGVTVSFIVGLASMQLLKKVSKKNFLTFFGVYRIVLGAILLIL